MPRTVTKLFGKVTRGFLSEMSRYASAAQSILYLMFEFLPELVGSMSV